YEGFLKKLFLDMAFISKEDYYGKKFRIGKALNPYLDKELRHESAYDRLVNFTGGVELADKLWATWKNGRNLVFHWFPDEKRALTIEEAKNRYDLIIGAIDAAYKECKIK
ncbi:hypothetical protein HY502_01130, partial [Candidatus Woesebacteria bacterium]|nr:hypothetical protein [Candidatus Woesebacteria bacterium]